MITALGKELRKMRLESGELLKDMADKLGITPAYLSTIENGKKKATKEFVEKVISTYKLNNDDKQSLYDVYFSTIDEICITTDNMNESKKNLGLVFARKFVNLDTEDMEQIMKILTKSKET